MRIFTFFVGILLASAAHAQVIDSPDFCPTPCNPPKPRIDPTFQVLQTHLQVFGRQSPIFGPGLPDQLDLTGTGALLRFEMPPPKHVREMLAANGVHILTPLTDTSLIRAWISFSALETLGEIPGLREVEASWRPIELYPLEVSTRQMGAQAVRRVPSLGYTGKGVIMATIDSGLDPTHPHLFHPDGGYYDWIDVNQNGVFDPSVDAVDLNQDTIAGLGETLRILKATGTNPNAPLDNDTATFNARFDWLYADQNRDGVRNFGFDEGFSEDSPGYGEQIFVVDDINQNNTLDPGEKLVRLKTSKILEFHDGERIYTRGVDLIKASKSATFVNSLHGTGVSSILVGGQADFHDRVGVAPDAELIVYAAAKQDGLFDQDFANSRPAAALETLIEYPTLLILHEWTNPVLAPLDGSGVVEAMMDEASSRGIIQVNPVGNLNLSEKHIERPLTAGETTTLEFIVGDGERDGFQPYKVAYISVFWRNQHIPTLSIRSPSGTTVDLPLDGGMVPVDNTQIQATHTVTLRGTHHARLYVFTEDILPEGTWAIEVKNSTVDDLVVGRISDYYSGWGRGIRWVSPTRDKGTIVYPATADSAFGVGAFASRWPEELSGLREFSGRGPRIDGQLAVDVVAPDDPYVAVALTPPLLEAGYQSGWFFTFGGTSGAAPHVAGALALLSAAFSDLSTEQLQTKLRLTASLADSPDDHQGHGRIDVYRALTGLEPPNEASLTILASWTDLGIEVESDQPDTEFALDIAYDGTLDRPWQTQTVFEEVPVSAVKVLARNVNGARASVLLLPDDTIVPPDPQPRTDNCESCSTAGQTPLFGLLILFGLRRRRLLGSKK